MAYAKTMIEQLPRTGKGFSRPEHYDDFRQLIYDIVKKQRPMTVRQVYYQADVKNYVEKTQKGYNYIDYDLIKMRNEGMMPYTWIVDTSRRMRGSQGWNQSVQEFMEDIFERIPNMHTRDLLADHEFSIQVWIEKEALVGVIHPITMKWDVPLVAGRGYESLTLRYDAAQDLESKNRPAKIFQLGDGDASGQDAMRNVREELPKLAPKTAKLGIEFHVIAIKSYEQVEEMNLPTRLGKSKDPRSKNFDWPSPDYARG